MDGKPATECRYQREAQGRVQPMGCEDFPFEGARFDGTTLHFSVDIDYNGTGVTRTLPLRLRVLAVDQAELADTTGKIVRPHQFSRRQEP